MDYLRDLGAQVRGWGVDMVKLDFLYQGAQEGQRYDPRVTGTAGAAPRARRDGRSARRPTSTCSAAARRCCPMVGICHANRIGHDLAVPVLGRVYGQPLADGWTGWKGIKAQARQAAARWALHGRWFHNDPEIVMAWGSDGRGGDDGYSLEESHTQAVVAALVGGPFLLADQLSTLLPEERAVLEDPEVLDLAWDERGLPADRPVRPRATTAASTPTRSPADLPSVWVAERAGGTVVALFNWTDVAAERTAPDGTTIAIPAHGARVLRVTSRDSGQARDGGQARVDVEEVVPTLVDVCCPSHASSARSPSASCRCRCASIGRRSDRRTSPADRRAAAVELRRRRLRRLLVVPVPDHPLVPAHRA